MPDWIDLDPTKLNPNEKGQIHGVEINVGLPPYEVPDAVRGHYDDDIKRFVIELNYLDDEEERIRCWHDENITLFVGKHSGCLYEMHINVDRLRVDAVGVKLWVQEAIRGLTKDQRYSARKQHYEVASGVVSENAEKLLEGV